MSGAALFGKLPAHGDFVARGLSAETRAGLDAWLSASLADARAAFGTRFADAYDAALPWRCASEASSGAIAASQDAAGRRFPVLLLVGEGDAAAACEELLYAAIGEGWDADRLARAAGGPAHAPPERWWCEATDRALAGAHPPALMTAMLTQAGEA